MSNVLNRNRYKFSTEEKKKQTTFVFIKTVAQTLGSTKSWCV